MISCPEAAASIRGVNPDPGSLSATKNSIKKVTEMMGFLGVTGKRPLLYIGIGIAIQKELDHLLVARACAVKQSGPSSAVFQLQISTLLLE